MVQSKLKKIKENFEINDSKDSVEEKRDRDEDTKKEIEEDLEIEKSSTYLDVYLFWNF